MNALQSLLSRRQLLRGGAALGLASLPASLLLSACGGGGADDGASSPGNDTPGGPRETRTLNFDLSAGAVAAPRLQLYNSKHHGQPLLVHTPESREAQRGANPDLAAIPDEHLTHFLPDVDLPAAALQSGAVIGTHPQTGAPVLVMPFLHVPSKSLKVVADRRTKTPLVASEPPGLLRAPAPAPALLGATALPPLPAYNATPRAVAQWLIFQHPAITNLDPDLGGDIVDRINTLPSVESAYLGTLMYDIAMLLEQYGYPTTSSTGSWAVMVPRKDSSGNPVLDGSGQQIYSYTINPTLAADTATIVKLILNSINNDPIFSGTNWQPSTGAPVQTPVAAAAAAAVGAAGTTAPSTFSVTNSLKIGSRTSGIRFKKIECADDRTVTLTVANEFLRSAGAFVEYRDAAGTTLAVDNKGTLDTDRAKFVGLVSPDVQIMGVPLLGKAAPTTELNFTMPDDAAQAILYYGGLGLGGKDSFGQEALLGTVCTMVINIGLPAICLAYGVFEAQKEGLSAAINSAMADETTLTTIFKAVAEALAQGLGSSIQTASTTLSLQAFLTGIGDTILDIFMSCAPRISVLLAAFIGEGLAQDAIPFVGAALWALSTAADIATIGETIIECVSCPAIDTNAVTLTMDQMVSISRDPNDYEFPATATLYTIVATYDGKKAPNVATGSIAKGTVGPLNVDLGAVASGGAVIVEVTLTDDVGTIVGYGKSASLSNLPATAAVIPVTIQEMLVPLSGSTSYQHSTKLVYQNGAHAWSTTGAPAETRTSLKPGADNALTALYDVTMHTASGMAGYAFAAGGQNINLCSGDPATDPSSLRNVFLGNNPDSAAKFSSCGASQPMAIVYDASSQAPGGNNFFLQPGGDGFYYLRGTTLDATNFNMTQTKTWGRFSNPMSKLCVVAGGYVVGVNRDMHKMEILTLPAAAQPATNEVVSAPFSSIKSGYGSLPGLLDTPVAVCSYQNNVLVLEQGNQRVQAFDPDGSSITPPFLDAQGAATPIMMLQGATPDATYLDIAVEGLGYIYVLWYSGDGSSAGDYHLDIYTPTGAWMSRTTGVAAGALAVDVFRNVVTLNYETVAGAPQVEPSLSQWLPHGSGTPVTSPPLSH